MFELAGAAARLDPPVADLEALAGLPMPRPEDLAQFADALEAASAAVREAARMRQAVEKEIDDTTGHLAQLAAGRPLATADRIAEARARRARAWRPLRAAIFGAHALPQASLVTDVAEFERLNEEADRLTDDAVEDAARLAKHGLETQRLDEQTRRYALAQAAEARAAASLGEAEQTWRELWRPVCISPRPPVRMQEWSGRIEQLMKTRDKLAARNIELEAKEAELARIEPVLRALGLEAGLSEIEGLDCIRLAERFERRLEDVSRAWEKSRELEMRLTEGRRRLGEAKAEDAAARALLEDWRRRWVETAVALGLEARSSLDGAEAALQVWDKASDDGENHRKGLRRVVGIQRNMSDFETEARALVIRCAPAAADLPAEAAARLLNERLVAARAAQTQRHGAAELRETARRALDEARARLGKAKEAMAAQAGRLPPGSDAVALLAREAERSQLAEALRQQRLRLADLADGVDEARLIEEMKAFDPDAAAASLTELERRDEDLGQQEKDRYAERDRLQRKREEFESGIGAETALQQRRNAEAELVEAARRWAVLKAASALLGGALEDHRAARRDPLMTRAGEAFAILTGGAFAGLDQSFQDDDEARLEACRANGERAPVAHLSEGARDQLYLALRLAYIEDYAARAEAPPFIGDDIFASFDEPRTGAGLEALAAIGDRIQTIVFTHHLHVIEEARVRLGDAADIIRISAELAGRSPSARGTLLGRCELGTISAATKDRAMPRTQRKSRWSGDVTAHSDALDLEPKVFEKKTAGQIAASLKRSAEFERSTQKQRFPVSDVDVDFLHQSRRTKPAGRTEAHPRSCEGKIARDVRTRALNPGLAQPSLEWARERSRGQGAMTMPRRTSPPRSGPLPNPPGDRDRDGRQPYATEVEDYQQGVATPPVEQRGREVNPRTAGARTRK